MLRGLERRLDRQTRRLLEPDRRERQMRIVKRIIVDVGTTVVEGLERAGINPERARAALYVCGMAAEALRIIPDTPELLAADIAANNAEAIASGQPKAGCWIDPKTTRMIEEFRAGGLPNPDFDRAGLQVLYAWCMARKLNEDAALAESYATITGKSRC